ncbi:histidine kinase, partial [Dactylosporangium sp. NPDC049742]|uniref:sensor histidine kinase n=1 Tax=Dactylosporangium sp. NPDC049742 TaxID=3154737 RepID=UPI00344A73EA
MRRRPPWTRELREARDARHAARLAHRMESMERHGRRRWGGGPHPAAIVIAMALVQVLGTRAAAYGSTGPHVLDGTAYLLLLAGPIALAVRERWPLVSLVGALVPTAAYFSMGYPDGPGFVAAIVAMFTALASGYRWLTWAAVAAAFSVFAVLVRGDESLPRVILIGVWCLVIAGFGEAARVRGMRYSQMARDWSAQQQLARAEEEKARAEQERRQASDERLLIARELHDVIGHHLSLINVQAGVGLHLMDEQPEQARVALAAIKHASAEALRETRSVLAGLNPAGAAPRTPAPGLRDLDRLAEEARAVGLPVTVDTTGVPRPLPPQVDRAAFRIVQEALTNVRRHAGPGASATIAIGYTPTELTLHITDDGHAKANSTPAKANSTPAQPSATARPSTTAQPPTPAQPPTTAQPSATAQSSATAQPPVTVQPSATAQPPVTVQPSATAQSSATVWPSVKGQPTAPVTASPPAPATATPPAPGTASVQPSAPVTDSPPVTRSLSAAGPSNAAGLPSAGPDGRRSPSSGAGNGSMASVAGSAGTADAASTGGEASAATLAGVGTDQTAGTTHGDPAGDRLGDSGDGGDGGSAQAGAGAGPAQVGAGVGSVQAGVGAGAA